MQNKNSFRRYFRQSSSTGSFSRSKHTPKSFSRDFAHKSSQITNFAPRNINLMSMPENLIIVESPAKAKTIEKFLGNDFKVMSSYGHIRDLKGNSFSIDVENNFMPEYVIPEEKEQVVNELRKAAKKAKTVWLASDEDREGEAIAWHLAEVLGLDPKTTKRIVFHEITKKAILNAIKHPRTIDLARVDAQQARRVLDRIVGFELSPVLWKKVKPALSAGRVQSVAVRLIAEREEEIKNFVPERYFRVAGHFTSDGGINVRGEYSRKPANEEQAENLLRQCTGAKFTVSDVSTKPITKSPAPPFTTSTLQQEAARKLGFSVAQTMRVAQRLYEAGHITYMRTDSLNLSDDAVKSIAKAVSTQMGEQYVKLRQYHTQAKGAQEAHEAIRPTVISTVSPAGVSDNERRLYNLIRLRTIASQMADAQIERTTAEISSPSLDGHFTATGEVVTFDGFLKVYNYEASDTLMQDIGLTAHMAVGQDLTPVEINASERFTQHPARYTEATLVKKLEELGIGRPSTYAPTISTIQSREYIVKGESEGKKRNVAVLTLADGEISKSERSELYDADKGKLKPTDIGTIVNQFLTQYFPEILDYNFTASVEERFDEIAEGKLPWNSEIKTFYSKFHPQITETMEMKLEHKVGERLLGEDSKGRPVSVKIGRYGPLVQIGNSTSDEKPMFASLLKGQSVATITLEEALKLFDFPRSLGDFEGKAVTVAIGRFGPYIRHDNKFVSIPKTVAPTEVTLDQAIELIEQKRQAEAQKVIKTFDTAPDTQILNGRYGVYISANGNNYRIPKSVSNPAALTLEEVNEIIKSQDSKPAAKSSRKRAK